MTKRGMISDKVRPGTVIKSAKEIAEDKAKKKQAEIKRVEGWIKELEDLRMKAFRIQQKITGYQIFDDWELTSAIKDSGAPASMKKLVGTFGTAIDNFKMGMMGFQLRHKKDNGQTSFIPELDEEGDDLECGEEEL